MAEEASETSVVGFSAETANSSWWEFPATSTSTWSFTNNWPQSSRRSDLPCDDDLSISNTTSSFTDVSNHLSLNVNTSSADLSGEPVENHLWNQVLLNIRSSSDMQNRGEDDDGENFLEALTAKILTTDEMFEPACDYLRKLDSCWELANALSLNSLETQFSNYNESTVQVQGERVLTNNISDHLVCNWSVAPPNPQLNHHVSPSTCINLPIGPLMAQCSASTVAHIKHEISKTVIERNTSYMSPYMGAPSPSFLRPPNSNGSSYQIGINSSAVGFSNRFCAGLMTELPLSYTRSLSDLFSFISLNMPSMELGRPYLKSSDLSDSRKQGYDSLSGRGNGRVTGTTEGKNKRSDDSSETQLKKSKHENSTNSSRKSQAPKVKLADKITALQQLVSPFGKTDTASVLLETINCIRILQEQLQLLSDPYLRSNGSKNHNSWGVMERKEKAEPKLDLISKGICLVPVSCIPQVHRENCGPDYWMPTY